MHWGCDCAKTLNIEVDRRRVAAARRLYYCSVCVFITAGPIIKLCAGGGTVKDMCYEVRRAEACVDQCAHHALMPVNARERDIV